MNVLITGFGPFADIDDNPSGRLARALDGRGIGPLRLVGRVLPVSYARAPAASIALARELDAGLVLGTGVAARRERPELERVGRRALGPLPDVDGVCAPELEGPDEVPSTLDLGAWADALGCGISEDAGGYVCNAWLHQVARALAPVPVGFLHVPLAGVDPERVVMALRRIAAPA